MIFALPASVLPNSIRLTEIEEHYTSAQTTDDRFSQEQIEIQDNQGDSDTKKIIFSFLLNPDYGLYHNISAAFQGIYHNDQKYYPVVNARILEQRSILTGNLIEITVPLAYCLESDYPKTSGVSEPIMSLQEDSRWDEHTVNETFIDATDEQEYKKEDYHNLENNQHRTRPIGQLVLKLEVKEEEVVIQSHDMILKPFFRGEESNWARLAAFYSRYGSHLALPLSSDDEVIDNSELNELTDKDFFEFTQHLDNIDCYEQLLKWNCQDPGVTQRFLNIAKSYGVWRQCNRLLFAAELLDVTNINIKLLIDEYKSNIAKALFIPRNVVDAASASILIEKDIINAESMLINALLNFAINEKKLTLEYIKLFFESYLNFIKPNKKGLIYSPAMMSLSRLYAWSEIAHAVLTDLNAHDFKEINCKLFIQNLKDIVEFQRVLSQQYIDGTVERDKEEKARLVNEEIERVFENRPHYVERLHQLEDSANVTDGTVLLDKADKEKYTHYSLIEDLDIREPFFSKSLFNKVISYVFDESKNKGFMSNVINTISRFILLPFKIFVEIPLLLTSLAFYRLSIAAKYNVIKFITYPLHKLFDTLFFIARATSSPIQNEKEMRKKGGWWSALSIATTMVSWGAITIFTLGAASAPLAAALSAVLPATAMAELTDAANEINHEAAPIDRVFPQSSFTFRATITAGLAVLGAGIGAAITRIATAITFVPKMFSRLMWSKQEAEYSLISSESSNNSNAPVTPDYSPIIGDESDNGSYNGSDSFDRLVPALPDGKGASSFIDTSGFGLSVIPRDSRDSRDSRVSLGDLSFWQDSEDDSNQEVDRPFLLSR
jgi:hypothetical protein